MHLSRAICGQPLSLDCDSSEASKGHVFGIDDGEDLIRGQAPSAIGEEFSLPSTRSISDVLSTKSMI